MNVRFQQADDLNAYRKFNQKAFPARAKAEALDDFRYANDRNPDANRSANVLAVTDKGEIAGQALYHPVTVRYQGKETQAEWGFDFFVDPEQRNDLAGVHILEFVRDRKLPVFATGLGDKALKIQKYFGYNLIGHLKKYVKLQPLLLPFTPLPLPRWEAFPKTVKTDDRIFRKVTASDLPRFPESFNPELMEFDRSPDFLNWRFFSGFHTYAVYVADAADGEQPLYFAVRPLRIKKIRSLMLVDFRFDTGRPEDFRTVLSAFHTIASAKLMAFTVCGSSLKAADDPLEAQGYKAHGRDRPIVANRPEFKVEKARLEARNAVFATLADSDGELTM